MATTSQKMMLMRFFVVIRGARTPAPMMEAPVIKIPQAAPTTENPIHDAIPKFAQRYGDVVSKNSPKLNVSPCPVKSISVYTVVSLKHQYWLLKRVALTSTVRHGNRSYEGIERCLNGGQLDVHITHVVRVLCVSMGVGVEEEQERERAF